jgi:hypothetical protein
VPWVRPLEHRGASRPRASAVLVAADGCLPVDAELVRELFELEARVIDDPVSEQP